uniref:Uncharacterized protein n=1 Tax=Rhizophora mucronata TaxID=61149 RepID=A0A2P2L9L2_RHIMU
MLEELLLHTLQLAQLFTWQGDDRIGQDIALEKIMSLPIRTKVVSNLYFCD